MVGTLTNPETGKTLQRAINSEALIPDNNLADLRNTTTALSNVGITASTDSLNYLNAKAVTASVTAVAGAANVSTVTITAKDASGATVAGVQWFLVITTSDAAGGTISATAYSGSLVAGTGTILITHTAKHAFLVATDSTGVFVGSLTDTAKTADFVAVWRPVGALLVVSSAMAFG